MAFKKGDKNINKNGRPLGATTRPQLRDYMTDEEIKEFMETLLMNAKTDMGLQKFVAEQILGKASQSIALSNPDGTNLFGDEETKNKTKQTTTAFLKGESEKGD